MGSKKHRNKVLVSLKFNGPAFNGGTGSGENMLCKKCSSILATDILPPSIYGVYIKCFKCSAITRAVIRPEGQSLPLSKSYVMIQPNNNRHPSYNFGSAVNLKNLPLISEPELQAYRLEVGYKSNPMIPLSQHHIGLILDRCKLCFGDDLFSSLITRASGDKGTPLSLQHPLIDACVVLGNAAALDTDKYYPYIEENLEAIKSALVFYELTERWKRSPFLKKHLMPMKDADNFWHNIAVLSVARLFVDKFNLGPNFHNNSTSSDPDFALKPMVNQELHVEVKTPSYASLIGKTGKKIRKASEQHKNSESLLIAMCLFNASPEQLRTLDAELSGIMRNRNNFKSRKHLSGVALINHTLDMSIANEVMHTRLSLMTYRNENYAGPVDIRFK